MSIGDDNNSDAGEAGLTQVAEYVLGLLDAETHIRVGRAIEADPRLRAERDFWQARFAGLDHEFADVPAPAHALSAVQARLFGKAPTAATRWFDSLFLWRGLAAGAVAVAVAVVGFGLMRPASDSTALTQQLVAALQSEGSDVQFIAVYDGEGNVRLAGLSGAAQPGSDFELWAIQGGNNPISMGVIPAGAKTSVPLSPAVSAGWGEGSVLAITLEQAGGSPDGNPHGPIVAQGVVTNI